MPDTCDTRAPGMLIPGASVRLRCPGGRPGFSIASDAGGKVRYEPQEGMPNDCEIVVEKAGYVSRVYSIEEICAEDSNDPHPFWTPEPPPSCAALSLSVRLIKQQGAASASPGSPASAPPGPPADAGGGAAP